MTVTPEIRAKLLELAKPEKVSAPDVAWWIERARELEDYVTEGQSPRTPQNGRRSSTPRQVDNSSEPTGQLDMMNVVSKA